jgi:hypothetical protein
MESILIGKGKGVKRAFHAHRFMAMILPYSKELARSTADCASPGPVSA